MWKALFLDLLNKVPDNSIIPASWNMSLMAANKNYPLTRLDGPERTWLIYSQQELWLEFPP